MTLTTPYANRLAEERAAAGIESPERMAVLAGIEPDWYAHIEAGEVLPTLEQFDRLRAALGDIDPERLYVFGIARTIGGAKPASTKPDYAGYWGDLEDAGHLLVSREEQTWLERNVEPDRQVDVFVNMSCGPQHSPHIMLNIVAVLQALGVNFAAGAGRLFCCGNQYRAYRDSEAAQRMHQASVGRTAAWGARRTVHLCTQCVNTFGDVERRERLLGNELPVNEHLYPFLERLLHERGDQVPWKGSVKAKVLVLRQDYSPVHTDATETCARVLAMIPGVEVVGFVDDEINKVASMRNALQLLNTPPLTADDVHARRERLAELFAARGADTMAAMHHTGEQWWARLASDRLAVRHPVAILAAALGCEQPNRYQAAIKLGDPEAILEQTRPIWTSWGMNEDRARHLASKIFDPAYAAGPTQCTCGGVGGCGEQLISADVLAGGLCAPE